MSFVLVILAACFLLRVAAWLLLQALPVLVPAAAVAIVVGAIWHFYNKKHREW